MNTSGIVAPEVSVGGGGGAATTSEGVGIMNSEILRVMGSDDDFDDTRVETPDDTGVPARVGSGVETLDAAGVKTSTVSGVAEAVR